MPTILENQQLTQPLVEEIIRAVATLEERTHKSFGGNQQPLLVSVRSGAKYSMPGMMDTILNLGLTDQTVQALAANTKNPTFAYDCYRRLIQMYGDVVKGIDKSHFESYLTTYKHKRDILLTNQWSLQTGKRFARFSKVFIWNIRKNDSLKIRWNNYYQPFAVFRSWNNPRAITYRKIHKIAHDLGTAVTVQEMVLAIVVLQVELALLLLAIRRQDTEDYLVNFSLVHKEKMLSRGSYAKTD